MTGASGQPLRAGASVIDIIGACFVCGVHRRRWLSATSPTGPARLDRPLRSARLPMTRHVWHYRHPLARGCGDSGAGRGSWAGVRGFQLRPPAPSQLFTFGVTIDHNGPGLAINSGCRIWPPTRSFRDQCHAPGERSWLIPACRRLLPPVRRRCRALCERANVSWRQSANRAICSPLRTFWPPASGRRVHFPGLAAATAKSPACRLPDRFWQPPAPSLQYGWQPPAHGASTMPRFLSKPLSPPPRSLSRRTGFLRVTESAVSEHLNRTSRRLHSAATYSSPQLHLVADASGRRRLPPRLQLVRLPRHNTGPQRSLNWRSNPRRDWSCRAHPLLAPAPPSSDPASAGGGLDGAIGETALGPTRLHQQRIALTTGRLLPATRIRAITDGGGKPTTGWSGAQRMDASIASHTNMETGREERMEPSAVAL